MRTRAPWDQHASLRAHVLAGTNSARTFIYASLDVCSSMTLKSRAKRHDSETGSSSFFFFSDNMSCHLVGCNGVPASDLQWLEPESAVAEVSPAVVIAPFGDFDFLTVSR